MIINVNAQAELASKCPLWVKSGIEIDPTAYGEQLGNDLAVRGANIQGMRDTHKDREGIIREFENKLGMVGKQCGTFKRDIPQCIDTLKRTAKSINKQTFNMEEGDFDKHLNRIMCLTGVDLMLRETNVFN